MKRILSIAAVVATVVAGTLGLAACNSNSATAPSTVITDLQTGFSALSAQLPALQAADPTLAAQITPYVTQASALLKTLNTTSPTMTTDLATIDGIVNSILSTAATSGLVPAPFNLLVEGLAVLAPEIEAVVNPLLTPTTTTASAVAPVAHPDVTSIAQARALFSAYAPK
jgi:hypothetical protein